MNAKEWIRRLRRRLLAMRLPEGYAGVRLLGHRRYVGGRWDEIGALQLRFMREQGLEPSHVFLDVACGALRGGVHFIRYLDSGHYLGIEKEESLVVAALARELPPELVREKRPALIVSGGFEFDRFGKVPHFALANSLFTHLREPDIRLCLEGLRAFVPSGHVFFATFFPGAPDENPDRSHALGHFRYPVEQMERIGRESGWVPRYLGDWGHPRAQMMMRYEAA